MTKFYPGVPKTEREKYVENNLVEIRPSNIPNAGNGVFAKEDINSGEMLGIYRGEALTPDQFTKRFKDVDYATYVLTIKNGTINVDGEKKGYNWVSRVNGPRGTTMKTNIWWDDDGNVFSKRKIKAGDELLVSYGPSYWRGFHRHQKNKTMKKKKHSK
jgi:hypothetical protein